MKSFECPACENNIYPELFEQEITCDCGSLLNVKWEEKGVGYVAFYYEVLRITTRKEWISVLKECGFKVPENIRTVDGFVDIVRHPEVPFIKAALSYDSSMQVIFPDFHYKTIPTPARFKVLMDILIGDKRNA